MPSLRGCSRRESVDPSRQGRSYFPQGRFGPITRSPGRQDRSELCTSGRQHDRSVDIESGTEQLAVGAVRRAAIYGNEAVFEAGPPDDEGGSTPARPRLGQVCSSEHPGFDRCPAKKLARNRRVHRVDCLEPRLSFRKTVVYRYRIHLRSRRLAPGTID